MNEVVQVQNLTKDFTEVRAVDDLTFSVNRGEVYGFLGQNGAGKSTTIRMLLTLIAPSSGSIHIFGKELKKNRINILKQVGAIIEKPDLYRYLTALQNLRIMAQLSGVSLSDKKLILQLEKVGIADRAHSRIKTFSQGMKQRLGIACALVHDPQLIILDEPTNGLDPQGIADIRNLVLHLSREEGRTVFVSSHLLAEMELIADSMLIIHRGKKIAEGKVSQLLHPGNTLVELSTTNDERAGEIIQESSWAGSWEGKSPLLLKMHRNDIPGLIRFLLQHDIEIVSIHPRHSLEDYFLSLTTAKPHVAAYQD